MAGVPRLQLTSLERFGGGGGGPIPRAEQVNSPPMELLFRCWGANLPGLYRASPRRGPGGFALHRHNSRPRPMQAPEQRFGGGFGAGGGFSSGLPNGGAGGAGGGGPQGGGGGMRSMDTTPRDSSKAQARRRQVTAPPSSLTSPLGPREGPAPLAPAHNGLSSVILALGLLGLLGRVRGSRAPANRPLQPRVLALHQSIWAHQSTLEVTQGEILSQSPTDATRFWRHLCGS